MPTNKLKNKIIILFIISGLLFSSFSFSVYAVAPTISTGNATGILTANATLQGTITNDGNTSFPYEYYISGDDLSRSIYSTGWFAQTFTIGTIGSNINHHIKAICLKLNRDGWPGTPGAVNINIRATNATGCPSGANLSNGTTNGNTLLQAPLTEWRNISMSWYPFVSGTKYAIVVSVPAGNPSDFVNWRYDSSSPSYGGGSYVLSANSGTTWTTYSGADFMFKEYGDGCNASFDYGLTGGYGSSTSAQVKVTGNTVSQNIASLTNGKLYHFRIKASNKDGNTNGLDNTFLTKPNVPTSIIKLSYSTAINLTWTKGTGANRTLVRYSDSSYPVTVASGTLLYNNTAVSANATSLTSGKTYYFSLWSFTIWGALSQYSTVVNTYATTLSLSNSTFTFNFPEYLEVGDYILASGTIVNKTGIPINNIWVHTNIRNESGVNVTTAYHPFWVVDGYYDYKFSSSVMTPGVYFIRLNFTQTGTNYNATNILYLSQPGGAGHSRAMIYFSYYNTNEGLGLPRETLKLYINDTRIFQNTFESYTGAHINVKVKDYYNSTLFQQNYTINTTTMFLDLGLTFHSWKFGNSNNKYYMVSLLKQGATRWWERGIVPYGEVEYLIPSGTYRMRIYDSVYTELINQSFLITNSRVYVINGTNLTLIINGQSIIIGQLMESISYALTPDVIVKGTNPPLVYSVYDTEGMCLGNGIFKICPAVITIATTKTTMAGNWINSTPRIPTNGSVTNGTVTILKDELYIAGNASIAWVNITYTSNGTTLQNTTYIPSKLDLYGQNITINASDNIVVKRNIKYNQLKKFYWTYYSYEGRYNAGINISDPMTVPIYDVYCYAEFANDSNPDFSSVTMRDIANNGTIMKRGQNFDVSAGGVHFYLLSINASSSRSFTIEYRRSVSESFSYGVAESIVNGYASTVFQGGSYQYFLVDWINTGSLIFKGTLSVKLNFSKILDIDPGSIIIQDRDHNVILSSSGVTQAGDLLMFGSSVLGDVNPGGGRAFAVYFLFKTYPGANPLVYKLSTPLIILFGVLSITLFLIGTVICGIVVTASALLYMFDRRGKRAHGFMVLMAVFSLGIFFLIVLQLAGY